jgi:hypothetical protein
MVAVLQRYRGTIDEIQGDGLLAFFGAPLAAPDDTARAVACAVDMQCALDDFNAEQRRLGHAELGMGIGVNTGEVVVGNIGSERRTKYGAVGTAINMAYRIESETVGGQILVSEETYRRVEDVVRIRGTVTATLKGVDRPLTLYDIVGVGGDHQVSLPAGAADTLVSLRRPLALSCYRLEGKSVSPTAIAATLVAVGANVAELMLATSIAERSNVKLVLTRGTSDSAYELYGKIVALHDRRARLVFTSMPDKARAYLTEQMLHTG